MENANKHLKVDSLFNPIFFDKWLSSILQWDNIKEENVDEQLDILKGTEIMDLFLIIQ